MPSKLITFYLKITNILYNKNINFKSNKNNFKCISSNENIEKNYQTDHDSPNRILLFCTCLVPLYIKKKKIKQIFNNIKFKTVQTIIMTANKRELLYCMKNNSCIISHIIYNIINSIV
jgi:hypothetical protein